MTDEEQLRFDMLRHGPCISPEYVSGYFGTPWPLPDDVRPVYEGWLTQRQRPSRCGDDHLSRYELESFMQQKDISPKTWIGARLGMTLESLNELLDRLDEIGMRRQRYVVYDDFVADSLTEDIVPNLAGLRFRTFSDHNSFCTILHSELDKVLGLKVQPLFCATSEKIQEYPREFASNIDCITLAPLSGKHQMWLDFRKPLNLSPDRCSKLLYAENRDTLRDFCAGTQEPGDLDQYSHFLAGQPSASNA